MSISIPTQNGEYVEIATDSLPSGEDVIAILRAENTELHHWIRIGLAYYREGRYHEFQEIIERSGKEAAVDYTGIQNDQMKALDILAGFYVVQGNRERANREAKKSHFGKATYLYTAADKLKMYDTNHLAGRAYFCLVEGRGTKLDQAAQQFNFVLKQDQNNIAAMMGMACINFNKKDFKTALYYYKKCLRQKPDGPADFRVGIGMCLAKLNQPEKARMAFERALEVDPYNVTAMTALAIMDCNEQTSNALQTSIKNLGMAYKLEPDNPVVLVNLANHFFFRMDLARVEQLAQHALNIADSETIKAEACFQLARCFHRQRDYDNAFKFYYQATTLNQTSFILPYYGLAQLHIHRGEYSQAIAALEHILKSYPNCNDTLKMLGSLYAHTEPDNQTHKQKAREVFAKFLQANPDDTEVMIDLAQLLEHVDPPKSLALYEKTCDRLRANKMEPPAELINNIGSLYLNQRKYELAQRYFIEADNKLKHDIEAGNTEDTDMSITIEYNLARCMESLCLFDKAEALYKEILKKQANYTDCMIRLGCIARDRGLIYDASIYFKEAISVNQHNADPWTLIGLLHMTKAEWGPAQKKFEHILKMKDNTMNRTDAYSHVALGNVWLESLFNPLRDRANDNKFYERALQMFTKALKIQPKNMWAANGIACILAHKKMWMEARDLFTQVREATADFFDVWANIANVYMETKQYVPAIQMYSNAMKKFSKENDPTMLMNLARAFYACQKYHDCRESMEKAMLEAPDNILIKFNYAVVLKKMAKGVLEDIKATTSMVNGAIEDLTAAERIFNYIHQNRDDTLTMARLVSRTTSGEEGRECKDLLKQAQTYLTRAQAQDEEENRLKRRQEEERLALQAKMEKKRELEEEEKRKKEEELRAMRQSYVEMTKEYLKMPEVKDEEKKARGGGGRKKKGGDGEEFVNDSSDMGDWQGGGEEGGERAERRKKDKAAKKAARKKREKREFAGSGSDDEEEKAERKRKRAEANARKAEAKLSAKQSAKIKSRAFLSSEEDSSDGAPPPAPTMEEDSPPPAMPSSDSDDSEPKPRKKKPVVDSDASDSEKSAGGSPVAPIERRSSGESGSESETPKKKAKKVASSSEESDSD